MIFVKRQRILGVSLQPSIRMEAQVMVMWGCEGAHGAAVVGKGTGAAGARVQPRRTPVPAVLPPAGSPNLHKSRVPRCGFRDQDLPDPWDRDAAQATLVVHRITQNH